MNFLLVIIELFLLIVMAEVKRVNSDWKSVFLKGVGQFGPKFQVEGDVPTNHSSPLKTRKTALSYGIRMRAEHYFILLGYMCLTDRRRDGHTDRKVTATV